MRVTSERCHTYLAEARKLIEEIVKAQRNDAEVEMNSYPIDDRDSFDAYLWSPETYYVMVDFLAKTEGVSNEQTN